LSLEIGIEATVRNHSDTLCIFVDCFLQRSRRRGKPHRTDLVERRMGNDNIGLSPACADEDDVNMIITGRFKCESVHRQCKFAQPHRLRGRSIQEGLFAGLHDPIGKPSEFTIG